MFKIILVKKRHGVHVFTIFGVGGVFIKSRINNFSGKKSASPVKQSFFVTVMPEISNRRLKLINT